jgi:diguanylate cyclase (GGDEF)-like protein
MDRSDAGDVLRDSPDLLVVLGTDRRVRSTNPAFERFFGTAGIGADFLDLLPQVDRSRLGGELARAAGGATVRFDVVHEGKRLVGWRLFPVEDGRVGGAGRERDLNLGMAERLARALRRLREKERQLAEIEGRLRQVSFIDPLTGLWNRLRVVELLAAEWSRSDRYESLLSLLLVKIQHLAGIRAEHGASVADEVVKEVARRIRRIVRGDDILGRYDDTTFVVVGADDSDRARGTKGTGGAGGMAERIRKAVTAEPIDVGELKVPARILIGGATNRSVGVEIMEDLFPVAEEALREAQDGFDDIRLALAAEVGGGVHLVVTASETLKAGALELTTGLRVVAENVGEGVRVRVTDAAGRGVPDARVTMFDRSTRKRAAGTTDGEGVFEGPHAGPITRVVVEVGDRRGTAT